MPNNNKQTSSATEACPLCASVNCQALYSEGKRHYNQCQHCALIFLNNSELPTPQAEKHQYDFHINSPDDAGYCNFLNKLLTPLSAHLKAHSFGLDYGCGPGPTIATLLAELGHSVNNYDPIYEPDMAWQQQQYDFICSTEVIEHIHWPAATLDQLWACLKPGGVLGIMTKRSDNETFANWHYKNDPTHVRFYATQTFEHLAKRWQATLELHGNDVAILTKPTTGN